MNNITNIQQTNNILTYWVEDGVPHSVTLTESGKPSFIMSRQGGWWLEQNCTFNYDESGKFTGLTGDSTSSMLPLLVAQATLANSGGASLIGANVYQTQGDVNLERISVKRFGAIGDGVVDDTAAIQACIDYVEAIVPFGSVPTETNVLKKRPALYIPAGIYKIDGTLQINASGLVIYGDGSRNSVLMCNHGLDQVLLEMGTFNSVQATVFTPGPQDCRISDIGLFNDRWGYPHTLSTGTGLRLNGCGGLRLDRVRVFGFGVCINSPYGGDYNQFNDVEISTAVIGLYQGPGGQQTQFNKIQISTCTYGIVLDRAGQVTMNMPVINGCSENSIRIEAYTDTTTRYLTSADMSGTSLFSQYVINDPWLEGAAGGYEPVPTHYIYIANPLVEAYRNITINNAFIVSGVPTSGFYIGKIATSLVGQSAGAGAQNLYINNPALQGILEYWTYAAGLRWHLTNPNVASGWGYPKYATPSTFPNITERGGSRIRKYIDNRVTKHQDLIGGNGTEVHHTTDKVRYGFTFASSVFVGSITGTTLTVTSVSSGSVAVGQVIQGDGIIDDMLITAGSGTTWTVSTSFSCSSRTLYGTSTIYRFGFDIQNRRLFLDDPDANGFSISRGVMPTSGTYQVGSFVYNTSPVVAAGKTLLGWQRLTTGSNHVLNTDWSPCYVTNT